MSINNKLERKDFLEEIFADMKRKQEVARLFWNSDLCDRMIKDMIRTKEGFDAEYFGYFPKEVRAQYGWEDISTEDINMFINVMSNETLGDIENLDSKEEGFENFSFDKKGIHVSVLIGQGSSIMLSPKQ